jgi:DNA-binding XRE family transcriptional regulator
MTEREEDVLDMPAPQARGEAAGSAQRAHGGEAVTFNGLLRSFREAQELTQQAFARRMGVSAQYQCDLESGRRAPSVKYVDRLCEVHGRGPNGRNTWHALGARAHGWKVELP